MRNFTAVLVCWVEARTVQRMGHLEGTHTTGLRPWPMLVPWVCLTSWAPEKKVGAKGSIFWLSWPHELAVPSGSQRCPACSFTALQIQGKLQVQKGMIPQGEMIKPLPTNQLLHPPHPMPCFRMTSPPFVPKIVWSQCLAQNPCSDFTWVEFKT